MRITFDNIKSFPLFEEQQYLRGTELFIAHALEKLVQADIELASPTRTFGRAGVSVVEFYSELLKASSKAVFLEEETCILLDGEPFFSVCPGNNETTLVIGRRHYTSSDKNEYESVDTAVIKHWLRQCRSVLRSGLLQHETALRGLYELRPTGPLFNLLANGLELR